MKTVFVVFHKFDVDGGFGDAISKKIVSAIFTNESDAKAYVKKYSNPQVYAKPYNMLRRGELIIKECELYDNINEAPEFDPYENRFDLD